MQITHKIKALVLLMLHTMCCFTGMAQEITLSMKPELIAVASGTFTMGSIGKEDDEQPKHVVSLSAYQIGKYPITVGQYRYFCQQTGKEMPATPYWGWQELHPVVNVSYTDAIAYCDWLGQVYGGQWRLPTEAEWEYAARGGSNSQGYLYSGGNEMEKLGWLVLNTEAQTQAVGHKAANELGIYDMSGNAWEWCQDWYAETYYANSPQHDPQGANSGSYKVQRGGSWSNTAEDCRVTYRGYASPEDQVENYGFRVVLVL